MIEDIDIADYLENSEFGTLAYNAHYDIIVDGSTIELRPNGTGTYSSDEMPSVFADLQSDGDYFWYENVRMMFPDIQDVEYAEGFQSRMKSWVSAGRLADYLHEHEWPVYMD